MVVSNSSHLQTSSTKGIYTMYVQNDVHDFNSLYIIHKLPKYGLILHIRNIAVITFGKLCGEIGSILSMIVIKNT